MSASRRTFVLGAVAASAPAPARAQERAASHVHGGGARRSSFASAMHEQMQAMAGVMERAPMTGDPDRDFLAMMIPHHQGAIDMARLVLIHGRDPLTRQLAEEIIASQQTEIRSMQARRDALERQANDTVESFPALTGTRGALPQ